MDNNGSGIKIAAGKRIDDRIADTKDSTTANHCPVRMIGSFVKDYISRHSHPVNAALHIAGVPAVFVGLFDLASGRNVPRGAILIFVGYLFQYLGHRAQGNEVGEVTLIKHLFGKLRRRS